MMDEAVVTKKQARTMQGVVASDRMDKTITVHIERRIQHPLYKKFIKRLSKIHAHDENNECKQGDKVLIEECRPLSKTKSWKLLKIIETAK